MIQSYGDSSLNQSVEYLALAGECMTHSQAAPLRSRLAAISEDQGRLLDVGHAVGTEPTAVVWKACAEIIPEVLAKPAVHLSNHSVNQGECAGGCRNKHLACLKGRETGQGKWRRSG